MSNRKKIHGVSCYGRIQKDSESNIIVSAVRLNTGEYREFVWPNEVRQWTQLVPQIKTWAEAFGFEIDEVWSMTSLKSVPDGVRSNRIPKKEWAFVKQIGKIVWPVQISA
jgi:hypothetical protein